MSFNFSFGKVIGFDFNIVEKTHSENRLNIRAHLIGRELVTDLRSQLRKDRVFFDSLQSDDLDRADRFSDERFDRSVCRSVSGNIRKLRRRGQRFRLIFLGISVRSSRRDCRIGDEQELTPRQRMQRMRTT